ncbi:hypothetical protein [Rhodanobacter sp. MP7CTX1]|uniref:hypothetical protein n=1 Tax=Rhodanobacter sp. MP7CTX1 TaxID=2723084 RepID=UPI0016226662|nr:hypothetical protein [Rhodanobacter sp. MP7CTX1]MBB6187546.1 hypothetical protein [Rhodanobacter sp. MP7CTX1]
MIPVLRATPHERVMVRWTRAIGYGQPIDRWFASVCQPRETEGFAQIERVDGEWWLIVFPPWSAQRRPGLRTKKVRYVHPKTAKKHLEAWARVNWPMLERLVSLRADEKAPMPSEAGKPAT